MLRYETTSVVSVESENLVLDPGAAGEAAFANGHQVGLDAAAGQRGAGDCPAQPDAEGRAPRSVDGLGIARCLRFEDGQVRVVVKQKQSGTTSSRYSLLNNVGLDGSFDFTITDPGDGDLVFSAVRDGAIYQVAAPIPIPFQGRTVRFQAGDYQQADDSVGAQDGGQVIFNHLAEQRIAPRCCGS
jgi:hypothetical protein